MMRLAVLVPTTYLKPSASHPDLYSCCRVRNLNTRAARNLTERSGGENIEASAMIRH